MAGNQNHHVCIHGHFYQPPRENPWLGVIEEQESAAPFHDWNERICAESYGALTCSPVTDGEHKVTDLFNCYAHMSYNFGPTIFDWMQKNSANTLSRITLGDELSRQSYNNNGGAMAQVYNHVIMPLADERDKHTQIIWGLREFEHRYGREADSIWLAETAINMETVRTLIDHGIKYVLLSPLQAGYVRRFGESHWTGVPDGTIETRHPYRIFEVDGGGRTHFDRHLDIFFYDKDLSTQVSFNHLLTDAQKLEWHIRERMDDDADLPQLVMIATDGEIYGHHEKHGNRALAYFFNEMFTKRNMLLTNLSLYLEENPPCWEVRLWEGLDGKGSSWSCSHGVGRWEKDCGCGDGPHDWNQKWRAPLRQAFDELRHHVREIFRREMGGLVCDAFDARNDYIRVILNPDTETRKSFLDRHTQKELSHEDKVKLWQLLEMDRHAMLMYTSCGWFFGELSGLEPVQNMRYALRAAELAMNFTDTDLISLLEKRLEKAESNIPEQKNGAEVFKNHVLSTRYGFKEVTAVHAFCQMFKLKEPEYNLSCIINAPQHSDLGDLKILCAEATCLDKWTYQEKKLFFIAAASKENICGVAFFDDPDSARKIVKAGETKIRETITKSEVHLSSLPFSERKRFFNEIYGQEVSKIDKELKGLYNDSQPLLERLSANRMPLPLSLRSIGERSLTRELEDVVSRIITSKAIDARHITETKDIFRQANAGGLYIDKAAASRKLAGALADRLEDLMTDLTLCRVEDILQLLLYIQKFEFTLENWDQLLDRYWRILHLSPRPTPSSRAIVDAVRELGNEFGFHRDTVNGLTRTLFSIVV